MSTRSTLGSARRGSTARQRRRKCGRGGKETRPAHVDLVRDTGARSGDVDAGRRPARPACLHAAPQSPLGVRARRVRVSRAARSTPPTATRRSPSVWSASTTGRPAPGSASSPAACGSGSARCAKPSKRPASCSRRPSPEPAVVDDDALDLAARATSTPATVRLRRRARRAPPRARRRRRLPLLALAHTRRRAAALRHLVPRRARAGRAGRQSRRCRAGALRMGAAGRRARPRTRRATSN